VSVSDTKEVTCPNCDQKQEQVIHSSINVSLNPELKQDLFDGNINRFECKYCSHNSVIPVPLLYHDMDRKFAVHYFSKDSIKKEDFLEKFDQKGNMIINEDELDFDPPEYLYDVHVVFQMNELLNYIIFKEYLFDFHKKK